MLDAETIDALAGVPTRGRTLRRRGRQTVQRLLHAATEVVHEHGHAAARVDDVVERAGLSHGTFYLYYEDKLDIVRAVVQLAAGELGAVARELDPRRDDDDPEGTLAAWLGRVHVACTERRQVVVAAASITSDEVERALGAHLHTWFGARPGATLPELASHLAVLALLDATRHGRLLDGGELDDLAGALLRVNSGG